MKKKVTIKPRNLAALALYSNAAFRSKSIKDKKKYNRKDKHKKIDTDDHSK
jgi:hypothetical protein